MAHIIIELTNRCNLSCQHCFSGRHGGRDDLPLALLHMVIAEARPLGFTRLSYTGGDPTVYRQFPEVIRLTAEAGYRLSFNTNGWNFPTFYPQLRPFRAALDVITFSLDGASEATHDRLRGKGSFRRVMQAISLCVIEDLPFSLNMVVTAHNRHELAAMVRSAARLGAVGLRFGHLLPAPITTAQNFDLSPAERKVVENEIRQLQRDADLPVAMAPGFHTSELFPCAPLRLQELNIDCLGNVSKCCHLSGHGDGVGVGDLVGNLHDISFTEAYGRVCALHAQFRQAKLAHFARGDARDEDYFPCWFCSVHYKKVGWLASIPDHHWGALLDPHAANLPVASARPIQLYEPVKE